MKIPNLRSSTYFLLAAFFILLPQTLAHYSGATGMLLVAEPRAPQPFHDTVLYMQLHTVGGAQGFIVNVPLAAKDLPFDIPEEWKGVPLYYGGPVGYPRNAVFYMYRDREQDRLSFEQERRGGRQPDGIMFGYAGWTVLQLNYEMARKRWITVDYDPVLIFDTETAAIWDQARRRAAVDAPQHRRKIL